MIRFILADGILVIGAVFSVAAAGMILWHSRRRLHSRGAWWLLSGLRLLALAGILAALGRLEFSWDRTTNTIGPLCIFVDQSASMAPYSGELKSALSSIKRWASRERAPLEWYGFSATLEPTPQGRELEMIKGREETRLGHSLGLLRQRLGRDGTALILTDGVDTDDQPPPSLGIRAFAVLFGAGASSELEITQVKFPRAVFARGEAPFTMTLVYPQGLRDLLHIRIRDEKRGELIWQTTVTLSGASPQTLDLTLTVPKNVGFKNWVIETARPSWDKEPANNRASITTQILREKLRVLYLCGKPSFDYVFLRELIRSQTSRELVSFVILRNPEDAPPYGESELSLIPFPAQEIFTRSLGEFDVFVLQDFAFSRFGLPPSYLDEAGRFVRSGGGLVVISGPNMRQSPEYGPFLNEFLSLTALPQEPYKTGIFMPAIHDVSWWNEHFGIYPDPVKNLNFWRDRLNSTYAVYPFKFLPGSSLNSKEKPLLVANFESPDVESGVYPALATAKLDKGRVAWVGFSGSWLWKVRGGAMAGGAELYDAFWEGLFSWVSGDDSKEQALKLSAERQGDGRWRLIAKLTPGGSGLRECTILPQGDKVSLHERVAGSGIYEGYWDSEAQGPPLRARISHRGQQAEAEIIISKGRATEEFRAARDELYLSSLTSLNGGAILGQGTEWSEEVPQAYAQRLLEELSRSSASGDASGSARRTQGHDLTTAMALGAAFLLLIEWSLRRLKGMAP
ncbi:MAG: hypothetical protein HY547_06640 [Elusimicrobia bacterium]|nr:hypothetical protein [Elusimicrobiota bacterium]